MDRHRTSSPGVPGRPALLPDEAATWLVGGPAPTTVLALDAGLAAQLRTLGHDVLEPTTPDALPEASVEVVVALGAPPADLDAVAHVLRPGGRLAVAVPAYDVRIPWVRKLDRLVGPRDAADPLADVVASSRFGFVDAVEHKHWQVVDRGAVLAIAAGLPQVVALDAEERARVLDAVGELYDGYGRGADGMQLPWVTTCHRAVVVREAPPLLTSGSGDGRLRAGDASPAATGSFAPIDAPLLGDAPGDDPAAGTGTGGLTVTGGGADAPVVLIDFR